MAGSDTEKYGLIEPQGEDIIDVDSINHNTRVIASKLSEIDDSLVQVAQQLVSIAKAIEEVKYIANEINDKKFQFGIDGQGLYWHEVTEP